MLVSCAAEPLDFVPPLCQVQLENKLNAYILQPLTRWNPYKMVYVCYENIYIMSTKATLVGKMTTVWSLICCGGSDVWNTTK